ncbi:hypothetical protein AB0C18_12380 [Nonomuraea muscovyensis]|uniref:hypothetical protein n=1 Tax=Nonomuraea muscovyensis TaxID=1124761 RepID=UPI0033EA4165
MKAITRRDWWTVGGVGVVAAAAVIASFTAQAGLGRLAGWDAALALPGGVEVSLSWLLPLCVDAYGAVATRITVNAKYSAETRRHALIHAVGAVVVSIIGNAIYHALEAGVLHLGTSRWVLVVAVSMVPPVALGALAHLMALCARDDTGTAPAPAPADANTATAPDPTEPTPATPTPAPAVPEPSPSPAAPVREPPAKRPSPARKAPAPDVEELLPLGRSIAADHQTRGITLTRDRLREAIRQTGQSISTDRAGALLARLRSDPPTPTGPTIPTAPTGPTGDAAGPTADAGPRLRPVDDDTDRSADRSAA